MQGWNLWLEAKLPALSGSNVLRNLATAIVEIVKNGGKTNDAANLFPIPANFERSRLPSAHRGRNALPAVSCAGPREHS